ncbi:nuclear transport factor 2 family protein [Halioglobus maricola]|uniref:Nuclear transport factor 2 family protein n=1 Tax=Halioglobus maricola TaxID=2601894 RepID=A0A5P9NNI5_9GAMM|nr:nuclear transport factor 2 family protein [Halioglobus maricola]QFU77357.1 nuclear transport factor 2 family protein [Halioglobus maricola]
MSAERQKLNKQTMGITDGLPLQVSDGGIEELRRDIQRLMDMEAIRQLKHAYFRCVDTANMDELATLLHPDVIVDFKGGNYHWQLEGRDAYLENLHTSFSKQAITQHHGHHPEIQMLSDTEATGIWYLEDKFWVLNHRFFTTGTLLYWDRYVKEDGRWQILETRYERLYEFTDQLEESPTPASHYLATHGSEPKF